jgi:hypothetical protein
MLPAAASIVLKEIAIKGSAAPVMTCGPSAGHAAVMPTTLGAGPGLESSPWSDSGRARLVLVLEALVPKTQHLDS